MSQYDWDNDFYPDGSQQAGGMGCQGPYEIESG